MQAQIEQIEQQHEENGIVYRHLSTRTVNRGVSNASYFSNYDTFCKMLLNKGYGVQKDIKNKKYIILDVNGKKLLIYFSTHTKSNTNYLVNDELDSRIGQFVFFNPFTKKPNYVSASLVKEFIAQCKERVTFNNKEWYIRIPEKWVNKNRKTIS